MPLLCMESCFWACEMAAVIDMALAPFDANSGEALFNCCCLQISKFSSLVFVLSSHFLLSKIFGSFWYYWNRHDTLFYIEVFQV